MKFSRIASKAFITIALASSVRSFGSTRSLHRTVFVGACSRSQQSCTTSRSSTKVKMSTVTATEDGTATPTSTKLEDHSEAYKELISKLQLITQLDRASAVLSYDQLVFMPQTEQTSSERGAQMSALASVQHEKKTDPEVLKLILEAKEDLKAASASSFCDFSDEARLLELEKKSFLENERIPQELAARSAALSTSAYGAWAKARQASDFSAFEPLLSDCFNTAKEVAEAKRGDAKDISLYTQMLDKFETGMAKSRIDDVFARIQTALVPLIARVSSSPSAPSTNPLKGTFPIDRQKELSEKIVKAIGFDDALGRIDVSVHPFTSSFSPSDVRITSRFSDSEWYQGLAGTVHEGGHAIYEQNLKGGSALNIDAALSMGTHESQSLFWERHVGLSKPFWKWATPMLNETFEGFDYSDRDVYEAVNALTRSLIRVESDELTYPLHVILRYNIENDVIEGNLAVKDIPTRWNDDMKKLLDLDVPSDDKGCLQDVHWSHLAFGYFPTYLIGSATAAQLSHYCHLDIPDMDDKIERGEFAEIKAWLTKKVHRHGKRYKSLDELLKNELGEELNPEYFIRYLTEKYTELYKCD